MAEVCSITRPYRILCGVEWMNICCSYKMGNKRVSVKLENGNTILVRVGGGYTNILDYIDVLVNADS